MLPLPERGEIRHRGMTSEGIPSAEKTGERSPERRGISPELSRALIIRQRAVRQGRSSAIWVMAFFAPSMKISKTGSFFKTP